MRSIIEKFDANNLDQQVNWLNRFLEKFSETNLKAKQAFWDYFNNCQINDYDDNIKKFNLERWGGGDINPTIDIALVNGELKFATTRYGILTPLSREDCNKCPIKTVIMDFFLNSDKYFQKNKEKMVN